MRNDTNIQNSALKFFNKPENSKVQEQYAEYCFLKEIIQEAASNGKRLDIARSDFDVFGYDLSITIWNRNVPKTIFIQMKTTSGKTNTWDIHKKMLKIRNGCIILVRIENDKKTKGKANPKYSLFDIKNEKKSALKQKPKKENKLKCKIKISQFQDVTGQLLKIFENL